MKRITFYIGLETSSGGAALRRRALALDTLALYYDAMTVTDALGVWRGRPEPSLRVEVIIEEPEPDAGFTRAEQAQDIAREIARTLEQDAVGLSIETLESFQLITQDITLA